jgi:DNA-binding MarR family transcriptional regulator
MGDMPRIADTLRRVDQLLELAMLVKALSRDFERRMNDTMRPLGLTGPQSDALAVIGEAGPLSLKELGELLIAEAGHPSRLVDRLVEAGHVARRSALDDRRRVELSLTPQGRRLAKRVDVARGRLLEEGHALIAEHDIGPAVDVLHHLAAAGQFPGLIARRAELDRTPKVT